MKKLKLFFLNIDPVSRRTCPERPKSKNRPKPYSPTRPSTSVNLEPITIKIPSTGVIAQNPENSVPTLRVSTGLEKEKNADSPKDLDIINGKFREDDIPLDQISTSGNNIKPHHGCKKSCCMMIFKEEIVEDAAASTESVSQEESPPGTHLTSCGCKSCTFCVQCKDCFMTKKGLLIHKTKMHQSDSTVVPNFSGVRRRKSATAAPIVGETSALNRKEVSGGQFLSNDSGQSGVKPENYFHQGFCKCNTCTRCIECNFNFASRQGLQIHKSRIHPDLDSPGPSRVEHLS